MNELQKAMSGIKASDHLKETTMEYLRAQAGRRKKSGSPRLVLAAACLMLVLLVGAGFWVYQTPVSTISIDVNPSIEMRLNLFDRVVGVTGYNDDGVRVAEHTEVSGMRYDEAVETLLEDKVFMEYLKGDPLLVITVASENAAELLGEIEQNPTVMSLQAEFETTTQETVSEAHDCGFSAGKYLAYQELLAVDPSITEEEAQSMTMREIRDRIYELTGEEPDIGGYGSGAGSSGENCEGLQGEGSGCGTSSGEKGNGEGQGKGQGQGKGSGSGTGKQEGKNNMHKGKRGE